jgi:protein-tyrosine-phosphatase
MTTTVFVCPHGAAKSVIAAAYFNRLAAARGLQAHAIALGTDPDPMVAAPVAAALLAEGLDVRTHRPRAVTPEDLATASRVVSMGADLGDGLPRGLAVVRWDDVPPPSQDLAGARAVIAARIAELIG